MLPIKKKPRNVLGIGTQAELAGADQGQSGTNSGNLRGTIVAITNAFINAVEAGNVRSIRIMMKDSLLVDPTFAEFNQMEQYARNINGLYDEHDGRELKEDKTSWNDDYMNKLMVQVVGNSRTTGSAVSRRSLDIYARLLQIHQQDIQTATGSVVFPVIAVAEWMLLIMVTIPFANPPAIHGDHRLPVPGNSSGLVSKISDCVLPESQQEPSQAESLSVRPQPLAEALYRRCRCRSGRRWGEYSLQRTGGSRMSDFVDLTGGKTMSVSEPSEPTLPPSPKSNVPSYDVLEGQLTEASLLVDDIVLKTI